MANINIEQHLSWFHDFTATYLSASELDIGPLSLKILHTKKVLENAFIIIHDNHFGSGIDLTIALAALYHDVGRFPQYIQEKTFKDSISFNHALVGAKILKNNQVLRLENYIVRARVLCAVALHNRFALKSTLPAEIKLVTNVVRDSDKCDIIRIMAEKFSPESEKDSVVTLNVIDDESLITQAVLEDAKACRVASYSQLKSYNDFKILLGTWIYDLHFSSSSKILKNAGYLETILTGMQAEAHVLKVRDKLLKDLRDIV